MANTEFLNLKLPATSDNIADQINIDTPDNLSKIDASLKAVHTVTKESIAENYLSAHSIPSTAKRGKLDVKLKGFTDENAQGSTNINVKSCGKNLFGGELEKGSINTDGTNMAGANNARSKGYINIKTNTQYKLTYSKPLSQTDIYYYDKNKVFISTSMLGFTNNPNAFTTPNNAYFAKIRYYVSGGVDISGNTMFEEGSTATPYEPYKGTEITYKTLDGQPITLHKLPNGVYDEITDDGKFIKRIAEKTLTENDVFSMHTSFSNVDFAKIPKPSDYIGYNTFTNGNYKLGAYTEKPNIIDDVSYVGTVTGNAEETNFFIGVANGTTLANAKTALAGTKLIYQLAQPQILDINATPLIAEPNGTVFITSESSPQPSVELSYPINLGAVVDGLIEGQKRLSELVQSLITT